MNLSSAVDTALDRSVALGYGNVGLWVRRRLGDWPADPPRLDGRTVLVTGAASGIGQAAATGFARLGAEVHVLGRDERRVSEAAAQVRRSVPGAAVHPEACDVSSLASLRDFVARFTERTPRLAVLVNNAGVMPDERERSPDGVELTFATHVLAPWVLIDGLAPQLGESRPARVINVTSGGMYGQSVPGGDVQSDDDRYGSKKFYARAKREQMVITEQWAKRLADQGVVVHAMHPGWADTKGVRNWLPVFRALTRPIVRSPEEGADMIVWLGGAPEPLGCTGRLWHDRRVRPTHQRLGAGEDEPGVRAAVWDECERLARGVETPARH